MFQLIYLATALLCSVHTEDGLKASCGLDARIDDALNSRSELQNLYNDYKGEHGVEHHDGETRQRLEIFRNSLEEIQQLRKSKHITWKVGITFMSHFSDCERSLYHGDNGTEVEEFDNNSELLSAKKRQTTEIPKSWDWRTYDAVTPVKKQIGPTCWAHSAVVPVEAQLKVLTGKLKELSTQELIDCTYYGKEGYTGEFRGHTEKAWYWMQEYGRVGYRKDIPDREKTKNCKWYHQSIFSNALKGYRLDEIKSVTKSGTDETPLLEAISTISPVAFSMQTKNAMLQTYVGGPYDWRVSGCQKGDGHAMVMVGYNSEFYLVKNTWGTKWGDGGYLWWVRAPAGYNCNIYGKLKYPVLEKKK